MESTLACVPATTQSLTPLTASVEAYLGAARAVSTQRIYRSDWHQFMTWCAAHGVQSLPASPATVAAYLSDLADRGLRAATVNRKLSAIQFAHKVAVVENPTTSPLVTATAAGIRRRIGVAQQGKAPACTEQLRLMLATLPDDIRGLRDRALLLLGFATASRRSELVALNVDDITMCPEGMTVAVRRSKTDQDGHGLVKGVPYGAALVTCPVRALIAYLAATGITTGPLFRKIDRHGHLGPARLTAQSVALIIKAAATAAGLDSRVYAGHSLRAGLATSAARAGVEERLIMQQGGWKTERMVRRYIREGNLFHDNAAGQVGL